MIATKGKFLALVLLSGLAGALGLLFFFAPEKYPFYPRCLFHSLTGWQCPGCGGLRATHRLLHGEIAAAFRFNALFVILLPVALAAGCAQGMKLVTGRDWLERFRRPFWWWLLLGVAAAFAIARNLPWA